MQQVYVQYTEIELHLLRHNWASQLGRHFPSEKLTLHKYGDYGLGGIAERNTRDFRQLSHNKTMMIMTMKSTIITVQ